MKTSIQLISNLINLDIQFRSHYIDGKMTITIIHLIEVKVEFFNDDDIYIDGEYLDKEFSDHELILSIVGSEYITDRI